MTARADLTGVEKAVSETLDEVDFRMHGLTSSGSYHQEFVDWLGERGYRVMPVAELERLRSTIDRARDLCRHDVSRIEAGDLAVLVLHALAGPADC